MTRKDYIKIAKIIKDNTRIEQSQAMIYKVLNRSTFIDDNNDKILNRFNSMQNKINELDNNDITLNNK